MQHQAPPVTGSFDRIRLHLLVGPDADGSPSSVWIMELADVDWGPPGDWPTQIEGAISSSQADGVVTFELNTGESTVLDIVARTSKGLAQVIADRHHVASMLETWAKPRPETHPSEHETSSEEAQTAVLFALDSHFATGATQVDSVDIEYEPGSEYFVHVEASPARYLGTVSRHGRIQLSQVVNRTDH